jgi:hypothetical protein
MMSYSLFPKILSNTKGKCVWMWQQGRCLLQWNFQTITRDERLGCRPNETKVAAGWPELSRLCNRNSPISQSTQHSSLGWSLVSENSSPLGKSDAISTIDFGVKFTCVQSLHPCHFLAMLWWLILCVKLTGLWGAQIFG